MTNVHAAAHNAESWCVTWNVDVMKAAALALQCGFAVQQYLVSAMSEHQNSSKERT
jgi:hypothetical protein